MVANALSRIHCSPNDEDTLMVLGDTVSKCDDDDEEGGFEAEISFPGDKNPSENFEWKTAPRKTASLLPGQTATGRPPGVSTDSVEAAGGTVEAVTATRLRPLDEEQIKRFQEGDSVCEYHRQIALTGTTILRPGSEIKMLNSWANGFGLIRCVMFIYDNNGRDMAYVPPGLIDTILTQFHSRLGSAHESKDKT